MPGRDTPDRRAREGRAATGGSSDLKYFDALGLSILAGRDFSTQEERTNGGERLPSTRFGCGHETIRTADPIGQLVQYTVRTGHCPS